MSNQPRTLKNKRNTKQYNKAKTHKRNHKCRIADSADREIKLSAGRERCESCININININGSGNTGTNCAVVNDRCTEQFNTCFAMAGDNEVARFLCGEAYNNCFANAGCEPPAQGGGDDDYARCMNDCTGRTCPGNLGPNCLSKCQRECRR
jgi:hypothetical protein